MNYYKIAWPNRLGFDVYDANGVELGEVWQTLPENAWGVRTFSADGSAYKYLRIDTHDYLFRTEEQAIDLCNAIGTLIE